MKDFYNAIEKRRTIYGISNEEVMPEDKLEQLIQLCVKHAPSAFNAQESRVILLLGNSHHRLWQITKDNLRAIVGAENFADTEKKIDAFAAGVGTILFYEDTSVTKGLQEKFPTYAHNFPVWASQASGIVQYIVWTALACEGYGANLQHYAEVIEDDVRRDFQINPSWKMTAQMPFGKLVSPADPGKTFEPIENRVMVRK